MNRPFHTSLLRLAQKNSTQLIVCLALGAAFSVAAGQDVSWDLQNYHLYNPFSVIAGRAGQDFFPPDKQSGLNPTLDFIYAGLALGPLSSYPRILAGVMGVWYGGFVFAVLQLARLLFAPLTFKEQRILIPLATLTASAGALTLSQIGTCSNDIAIALLTLVGLWCALRGSERCDKRLMLGSGLLFGLAAGAKFTAAVYAPALVLALVAALPLAQAARACALFCASWGTGFAVTFGWWGWMLWRQFGNPFFPMLNSVFHSPLGPQQNLRDMRFFPHSLVQWIAYPFFWAWNATSHTVYEGDFRDPRLALAFMALLGYALYRWKAHDAQSLTQPQKITAVFVACGYVAWLFTTSILRYALALEALSVLVFIAILMHIRHGKAALILAALACVLCLTTTRAPDWGHRPFADKTFNVDMKWVPQDSLILTLYEPLAYLAAFTPPEAHARFVALGFVKYMRGWPLGDQAEALIKNHQGPIVILLREERRPYLSLLPSVGLSPQVTNCRTITTDLALPDSEPVEACDVSRLSSQ